jgi:hypothetical protein
LEQFLDYLSHTTKNQVKEKVGKENTLKTETEKTPPKIKEASKK